MNTEDFIRALVADGSRPAPSLAKQMGRWLVLGIGGAIGLYFAAVGLRPDLMRLLGENPRIPFKIGVMLLLACLAAPLVLRLMRPSAEVRGNTLALIIVPVLLIVAVLLELYAMPERLWAARWEGHNALVCMSLIPVLAFVPFCALFVALRNGAPLRPALAGAGIGLLSGSIGAFLYAMHCPDDSPLFVATWYTIAIGMVVVVGALAGSRLLRW